jgi:hypothetical protein
MRWDLTRPPSATRTANLYKRLQLLSSAAFSIGHGGNDAQKVMGIITAALDRWWRQAQASMRCPYWVPLACYTAIGLGTLSGGWKIVKTMGTRITKVTPLEGVCAEPAGAMTLYLTEQMGIPVSTTHTITGAIIGVGATKRLSAVRWGVTIRLLWAWILTIPVSAVMAGLRLLGVHAVRHEVSRGQGYLRPHGDHPLRRGPSSADAPAHLHAAGGAIAARDPAHQRGLAAARRIPGGLSHAGVLAGRLPRAHG